MFAEDLAGLTFLTCLLVEVWVGHSSSFGRHVAAMGGAALRVCLPQDLLELLRSGGYTEQTLPVSTSDPPPSPSIRKGRVVTWFLEITQPTN